MKKIASIILICISMTTLCACGKNETVPEKDSMTEISGFDETVEDSETDILSEADWNEAYLSYLDTMEEAESYTYSLIYVDEDDIPELMMDSGFEAGGCKILTFHNGILDDWQSSRLGVTYIEKENLICNSDGIMGCYYDYVFTIQDGKWCSVEGGEWGYQWPDEEMIYTYKWNGNEVSEDEYKTRLNEVYPKEQEMCPDKYYIFKEIYSVLETGNVTSAENQYELVVEELTWEEAESFCREKGGYLATITSWEEKERIQEQIISENKGNITFFVGANNIDTGGGSRGYHWIEPGGEIYDMLSFAKALFDGFWPEGEPSYTGLTESGVEVDEGYVVLFYQKSDARFYLNDVPNDILSAAPSYSGRVGYICEYEK